ncbi:hypothetical protein AB0J71_49465 [Nonomuraea sp. NPDC049637]|uniref:hypothetical protein n=1 Tax=Nonomuraea sp. NPDC049637 TaxID=3154356 RepID=UPI003425583D
MKMIMIAVVVSAVNVVLTVAVLIFVSIYGFAAMDLAMCKIRVTQQRPVLEKEVTPLLARAFRADSVKAIDREDNCQFEPRPDLVPLPTASVVVTVADDAQHVQDSLAVMRREGWRYVEPFEEIDGPQMPGLRKEFSDHTVEVFVEYNPRESGGSGVHTWVFDYS